MDANPYPIQMGLGKKLDIPKEDQGFIFYFFHVYFDHVNVLEENICPIETHANLILEC